jgi:cellulose synthase operon protein YhjQ
MLRTEVTAVPDTPKDIAALYSRAYLQAARYGDFSASRQQVRGKFRARIVREPLPVPEPVISPVESTAVDPEEVVAMRWYALRSVFAPAQAVEPPLSPQNHPPVVALFSLAGGVGKTCLVATLGRALAALGEHLLLADTPATGMLPFYFGSRASRAGAVRTFFPPGPAPGAETDAPVQVLNLPHPERDSWLTDLLSGGRVASRILLDVATASHETTTRLQPLSPTILVPVLADMSSVVSLGLLEALPQSVETFYLLNQFDEESPLHLDVRSILQQQLGDRLLPFVVRRSPAVSEALAEGMTVIDYAPASPVAEDYRVIASWLRSFAAAAAVGSSGVRWTER